MLRIIKKLTNYVLLFSFVVIFLVSFLLTEKFSQSFHFVDEDDYLVIGSLMNKDYKLYVDISTNHQPVVYILSSLAQKLVKPIDLYRLIQTGRRLVFLYAFIFSLFLFYEYGAPFLIFSVFFELTKFFIFGNLLLAESLVIYPLIFILGQVFKLLFYNYQPKKWEVFFFAFTNFMVIFCLLPVIPGILILDLVYLIKTKRIKQFIISFGALTFFLFIFISASNWFRETIFYNLKYVSPALSPFKNKFSIFKLIIFPFLSFTRGKDLIINQIIKLFSVIMIINFALLLFLKKKYFFLSLLVIFPILILNNRILNPEEAIYYGGFHLLPYYGCYIFFGALLVEFLIKEGNNIIKFLPLLILFVSGTICFFNPNMTYFQKINKNNEHNVNFFPYHLIGEAIKAISSPGDRLAVIPDEELIYWQSGLKLATKQVAYYEWQYWPPLLKVKFEEVLTKNPPEFIYADLKRIGPASYLPILNDTLRDNYWQAISQGVAQKLFIKKTIISSIREDQWQRWQELSFDKIPLEAIK